MPSKVTIRKLASGIPGFDEVLGCGIPEFSLNLSPHGIAFLSDAIIMQRYVEIDGRLKRVLAVVKVRGSQHSKELREYEIEPGGRLIVGKSLAAYRGLLTGAPEPHAG